MKKAIIFIAAVALPLLMSAQTATDGTSATIKINNIHVDLNGEKEDLSEVCEVVLADGISTRVTIFTRDGLEYGTLFTYKKGKNRIKLVRKGYAAKQGTETKYGKQRKDMQEMRTSIPGNMSTRVVDNIVLDKDKMDAITVSFNYELIYKQ